MVCSCLHLLDILDDFFDNSVYYFIRLYMDNELYRDFYWASILEVDCNLRVFSKSCSLEGSVVVGAWHVTVQVTISNYCSFLVPEPPWSNFRNVFGSHVWNSSSSLSSWDKSIKIGNLFSIRQWNLRRSVDFKQIIEVSISSSEDFRLIDLNKEKATYWA